MNLLGENIKKLRELRGVTQAELARYVGVGKTTISNYETGYSTPDTEILTKIADFFSITTDYLLGRPNATLPLTTFDELSSQEHHFLNESGAKFGVRGRRQAEILLERIRTMFDRGEIPEEDRDEFFRAVSDIYFDAKEKNRKHVPKKYRKK